MDRRPCSRRLPGLRLAWCGAALAAPETTPARIDVAITDVSIVDIERGEIIAPRTILVANGRIVAIAAGPVPGLPTQARHVDGRGRFVMPGLVDMNVHLFNNATRRPPNDWAFPLFLANGVTAVREMAAIDESIAIIARWNQAIDAGDLAAPRILAAGIPVRGLPPGDARRQVAEAERAGAAFIKVFSEVPDDAWQAIRTAAQEQGLPVLGHTPAATPLLAAARDGLKTNEHLTQAYEACSTVELELLGLRRGRGGEELVALRDAQESRALATFDPATCERVAAALTVTGQVQVPTMALPHAESTLAPGSIDHDPRWCYLREDERRRWRKITASLPPDHSALSQRRWQVTQAIVGTFHRARVPLLAGTDAPMPGVYPGYALQDELVQLVAAGLSPPEALRAATLGPAQFLGLSGEAGTVEVGKRADLVLVDANPLQDIRNAGRIHAVLPGGHLLRREDLDAGLAAAAAGCAEGASRLSSNHKEAVQQSHRAGSNPSSAR